MLASGDPEDSVKSAAEYRAYAAECRTLAHRVADEHRDHILSMAEAWEELARDIDGQRSHSTILASSMLKTAFDKVAEQPVPDKFLLLLEQLSRASGDSEPPEDSK